MDNNKFAKSILMINLTPTNLLNASYRNGLIDIYAPIDLF